MVMGACKAEGHFNETFSLVNCNNDPTSASHSFDESFGEDLEGLVKSKIAMLACSVYKPPTPHLQHLDVCVCVCMCVCVCVCVCVSVCVSVCLF